MTEPMEKDLICIVCPNGCKLHGSIGADGSLTVTGNRCVRGKDFAGTEMTDPTRSITTTVETSFDSFPYLPVRTDGEIPKHAIAAALSELHSIKVGHVAKCGEVILENLAGTGVNVIATIDMI